MPDNWGFVAAAYILTAAVLGLYWRRLVRKERELRALHAARAQRGKSTPSVAERTPPLAERTPPVAERTPPVGERTPPVAERSPLVAERSREPSRPAHPRPEPGSNPSLQ